MRGRTGDAVLCLEESLARHMLRSAQANIERRVVDSATTGDSNGVLHSTLHQRPGAVSEEISTTSTPAPVSTPRWQSHISPANGQRAGFRRDPDTGKWCNGAGQECSIEYEEDGFTLTPILPQPHRFSEPI